MTSKPEASNAKQNGQNKAAASSGRLSNNVLCAGIIGVRRERPQRWRKRRECLMSSEMMKEERRLSNKSEIKKQTHADGLCFVQSASLATLLRRGLLKKNK